MLFFPSDGDSMSGLPGAWPAQPASNAAGETLRQKVVIANPLGLHMRPASAFAQLAGRFQSGVVIYRNGEATDGKSVIGVMMLAAEQGTELELEVTGPDARAALPVLAELLGAPELPETG